MSEAQVNAAESPDIKELLRSYEETQSELNHWRDQCQVSYDDRRNYWPGKTNDLRKSGSTALPWEGASDSEALVIGERIQAYVAMSAFALARANIRAYPIEVSDVAHARVVSSFLKWMRDYYIPDFAREMELAANYLFEKAHAITYVGWEQRDVTRLQMLNLQEIAATVPELAELIVTEEYDDDLVLMLQQQYPKLKKKDAKKALRKLRKEGAAELPVQVRSIDRPIVQALATDTDIFFPHYCTDPQKAPYVHRRVLMTPQEVLSRVNTEGWDEKWADHVIERMRGTDSSMVDAADPYSQQGRFDDGETDFIEVIYTYQRLMKDGAEGIYCTVWHTKETESFGKFELLNGLEDYPFVVTELHRDSKRMYEARSMVDLLRGAQWTVKACRDARIDRSSLATLPASKGPVGRPKPEFRPGGHVTERRPGEYGWIDPPPADPGSIEVEATMLTQADRMVGLSNPNEDPDAQIKRAFYIDKFLSHVRNVLSEAYKAFLRYGPDQLMFRVSGVPEPQEFNKEAEAREMDICVHFDAQMHDPETVEKKIGQFVQLLSLDRVGKLNVEALLEVIAASIDPVLADAVLQPQEQGTAKAMRDVATDLSMIYAGIEVPARPQGHQIALQLGEQYVQQPDVAERLQTDEAFAARLQKYMEQYQFAMQQQENAQIGRIGTEPAEFQGMQQQA